MLAVEQQLPWWIARSAGIVAWLVIALSIVWGLALSTRIMRKKGISPRLLDLHRYLGVLSIVFTAIHLIGLAFDKWVNFGWAELFIPFRSTWRPRAVAWGIVAFYLLVAIQITSYLMKKLPRRVWHTIHLTSFLVFGFGTAHAALAGADRGNRLVQWGAMLGVLAVLFLVIFRLAAPRSALAAEERAAKRAAPLAPERAVA